MGNKLLWLLTAAVVAMTLLILPVGREKGTPSSHTLSPPPVPEEQKVAALPAPKAEEPPPRPSPQVHEWKVLFHFPRDRQTAQTRRATIRIFFNRPVEQDILERAFSISPHVPGTFSWPRADRLVYTPNDTLLPATQYRVALTSTSESRDGKSYTLLGTDWSFTTGDTYTYHNDIKPLVTAYCGACHGPGGAAAHISLDTYEDVSRHVVPGRSGESRFYTFPQERRHHVNMAGPNHSTNDKRAVIRDWIDEDRAAR